MEPISRAKIRQKLAHLNRAIEKMKEAKTVLLRAEALHNQAEKHIEMQKYEKKIQKIKELLVTLDGEDASPDAREVREPQRTVEQEPRRKSLHTRKRRRRRLIPRATFQSILTQRRRKRRNTAPGATTRQRERQQVRSV